MGYATRPWLPLALLVAVVTALLLAPLPTGAAVLRWPELVYQLENLGHMLFFGLLAHFSMRLLRTTRPTPAKSPYCMVLLGAVVFGLATEGIQRLVGRDSAWIDLANDLLGASFVLLLHARREYPPGRWAAWAAAIAAMLATGPFLLTVTAYAYRSAQSPTLWRPNSPLYQHFSQLQQGAYPGLFIREPLADWSGYATLVVELRNLRNIESAVTVRVHDRLHSQVFADRYNQTFELAPSSVWTVRISLERIRRAPRGREMDMTAISGIIVFQMDANQPPFFGVDEIRLER